MNFDPYRKWLGIPSNRRPPTYYEMLGITAGENDADVIRSAIDQRRMYIRSKKGEGQDAHVKAILGLIEEATSTLLVPEFKHGYDRQLGLHLKKGGSRRSYVLPSWMESRVVRVYGEGSGIVGDLLGIVTILFAAFGLMAWWSFRLHDRQEIELANEPNHPIIVPQPIINPPEANIPPQTNSVAPPVDIEKPTNNTPASTSTLDYFSNKPTQSPKSTVPPQDQSKNSNGQKPNGDPTKNSKSNEGSQNQINDKSATATSRTYNLHTSPVKAICFSPNNLTVATGAENGQLKIWKSSTGVVTAKFSGFENEVKDIVFEPDGKHLWATDKNKAVRISVDDGESVKSVPIKGEIDSSFHLSSRYLASSDKGKIYYYDLQIGKLLNQEEGWFNRVALSPTEPIALLGSYDNNPDMPMVSLTAKKKIRSISHGNPGRIIRIAYTDSGKLFAISHGQSEHKGFEISIFDSKGNLVRKLMEPKTWQSAIDFSSDGRFVVAGGGGLIEEWGGYGKDCTVRVWEVESGKLRSQFTGHTAAVQAIQFSPDGRKIASCGMDKSVRVWDFDPDTSPTSTQNVFGSSDID